MVVGTIDYMSPEQARGEELDARTDLYSFGAVLYEMATGQPAFSGATPALIHDAILNRTPISPLQLNPELPAELGEIIGRALEKDREARYQVASEMWADLKRLKRNTTFGRIAAEAVASASPPAAEAAGLPRHVERGGVKPPLRRWAAIGLAGAAIILAALVGYWLFRPSRAPGAPQALAVVSIENMTEDRSLEWLERGVAELLTTNLAQAKALDVISTERVRGLIDRRTKGEGRLPTGEAQDVAKEARADVFLSGALLKVGPRLRLDLRVQETATGKVLFADKVEGEDAQAVFGMVDQATASILARLVPSEASTKPSAAASLTSNLEALRAYEEGRSYWEGGSAEEAASALRRATELDPQFAMAFYWLADALSVSDFRASSEAMARAAELAGRLPLPRLQKLIIQSAWLLSYGRREEAEQAAATAVSEFPRHVQPRFQLARTRSRGWKIAEAKAAVEEILRLDDRQSYAYLLLACYQAFEGDLPSALAAADRYAASFPPNDPNPIDTRGDILAINGRLEEALAAYRKNQELNPAWFIGRSAGKIALVYLLQGKYSLAEATVQSAYEKSKPPERQVLADVLGEVEVGGGRLERAVAGYEESARLYAAQGPLMSYWLLWKAARIHFEQGQPELALAMAPGNTSPWAAGFRGTAYLLLKKNAAAEKEFAALRALLTPVLGDYVAGKMVELHRLQAAAYAGRWQEVIANWPQLGQQYWPWYALDVGRAYLQMGNLEEAERHLHFALRAPRYWVHVQLDTCDFLSYTLAQFYLGRVLEQSGKRADAINAYREFLSHFENSTAKLAQIAEARAALKRLM